MTTRVVLASRNAKKLAELTRILAETGLDVEVLGAEAFAGLGDIPETGATFLANSKLKSGAVARHTGLIAIADDSGLAVDALNGMPGVLSARWAGTAAGDEANLRLVLEQTADIPDERRGAAFHCAATAARVAADGELEFLEAEADVRGRLLRAPRGSNGFGYDPVFVPDGFDITTAQMDSSDKDRISHRGKALAELAHRMRVWIDAG